MTSDRSHAGHLLEAPSSTKCKGRQGKIDLGELMMMDVQQQGSEVYLGFTEHLQAALRGVGSRGAGPFGAEEKANPGELQEQEKERLAAFRRARKCS